MQPLSAEILTSRVQPGRVHRSLYTDPAIFELEMERIFGRAWMYLGHESQIRHPGDYFCTRIGRKAVVVVRDNDGAVAVLHNQCAHRGAMVVALDRGNADEFQCCYHGWTYHLNGRSEEHTSELQSRQYLVCRLLLEKKKNKKITMK